MEMRLRESYGIKVDQFFGESIWNGCANSAWSPTGLTGQSTLSGTDQTMQDCVVPRFHARRKAGEVFFYGMTKTKVTVSTSGSSYGQTSSSPQTCSGTVRNHKFRIQQPAPLLLVPTVYNQRYGSWPLESTALSESDVSRLRVQCSTEVLSKRGRSDSDLWESLAEYRQTVEMLRAPLEQLGRMSKSLLQSAQNGVAGRDLLKRISAGYLLYRYGIIPLMKDVESILNSLQRQTGKQRKTSRSKGQLYATANLSGSFVHSFGVSTVTWSNQVQETLNIRCMTLDEVDLSFLGNLGFSLKGLLTLPWELMAYSFVADWFANIGDYIGSIAPSVGYNMLGSCMVEHRVTVNTYNSVGVNKPSGTWTLDAPITGTFSIVREHTTRGGLAGAGLVIKNDFKFSDFTRTADAFALLASRFTKVSQLVDPFRSVAFRNKSSYQQWLKQPGVS